MITDKQRAAFEAWFISDVNGSGADLDRHESDVYETYATQLAWEAWQAACDWKQDPCATGCKIKRAVQEMNDSLGPF